MIQKSNYAEDRPYWDTTVAPAKSLGEIQELLENFGAEATIITQGSAGGRYAWLIRFQWNDKSYRFTFIPLACRRPTNVGSFGGKKRAFEEQTRYQMGRIAVYFVKAILTAAETQPQALFGYMELSGVRSHTIVASDLNVDEMTYLLPGTNLLESGEDTYNDPQEPK
jgi:hypothetical protein